MVHFRQDEPAKDHAHAQSQTTQNVLMQHCEPTKGTKKAYAVQKTNIAQAVQTTQQLLQPAKTAAAAWLACTR